MATRPSRPASWLRPSLAVLLSLSAWYGCGGSDGGGITDPPPDPPPPPPPTVAQVTLSADSVFFGGLGITRTLSAQARASDGSVIAGASIAWQSSNASVASVSSGALSAVGVGEATVTATSGSVSATAKVVVVQVPAGLEVSPANLTLDSLGATATFVATVVDSGGAALPDAASVEWSSENGGVALVSSEGIVLARGPGTATVRAATLDGAFDGSAQVEVAIPALAGVVDASGGSVSVPGGAATLTIPRGAVATPVAVTAQAATPPSDADLVSGTAWTFGPTLDFAVPADLEIAYTEGAIPAGRTEESLGLYRLEGSTWTEAGSIGVDVAADKVVARVAATGTYAILAGRLGDPTGLWHVTETTTFDSCYDEAGLVEELSVYAVKNGDVLTVERDGEALSGTLAGNVFGWDETYEVEGVTVRETYTITIDRTGTSASGSGRFVGSGPVNCEIRTTLEAQRVGRDRPQPAPQVDKVTLAFVETPWSDYTWYPEIGASAKLVARAFDKSGAEIDVPSVSLLYTEPRVLTDAPGAFVPEVPTGLAPGLVGTTEIRAVAYTADGHAVTSAPVILTLARDTTLLRVLAPPGGTGRFFDMEPILVWEDDNAEVSRWEVFAAGQRLPLHLVRRGSTSSSLACAPGDRCVDTVEGLWDALGLDGDTPLIRLEGVNALGNVVSRGRFDFTHAVHNRVTLRSAGVALWDTVGHGYSPAGESPIHRYPNDRAKYCTDEEMEGCLHAYVQNVSPKHQILVVERRPVVGPMEFARIWIPRKILDEPFGTGGWNCRGWSEALPEDEIVYVNFRWLEDGEGRTATGSNDTFDTTPADCNGNVSVTMEEYQDIRGTWRIYTVSGEGTMIGPEGLVTPVTWSVTGAVKWADGDVSRPLYGGWGVPGR